MRLAIKEGRRRARGEQSVELAVPQHADEGLVILDRLQVDALDRLERGALVPSGLLLTAAAPMNLGWGYAIFVLHHAPHPDHRGDLILGQPDALAPEIGRTADAGIGANGTAGM